MHFLFQFLLLGSLSIILAQNAVLDINNPSIIQIKGNFSTSDNYILLVSAESTRQGNFFTFSTNVSTFPYFIKTYDLDMIPTNLTFPIVSSTLPNQDNCITTNNYWDCIQNPTTEVCVCFRESTTPSNCINLVSSQLKRHCTNITTYIDVGILVGTSVPKDILMSSPGSLTFHYMEIKPTDRQSWLVTATESRFWNFPLSSQPFVPFTAFLQDASFEQNSWETVNASSKTIFKTRLITHNYQSTLYCRYSLIYTGIIRGIYVNDYPGSSLSNPQGLNNKITIESSERLPLRGNEYNLVTIVGLSIDTTDLSFIDCRDDWQGSPVSNIDFEYYLYDESIYPSKSYTVSEGKQNFRCPSGCEKCSDSKTCVKCSQGFLYEGHCLDKCPLIALYPDYKGVCGSFLESFVLMDASAIDETTYEIKAYVDQPDGNYLMVLHSTSDILFGNAPFGWPKGEYALAESIPQIVTLVNGEHINQVTINSVADSEVPKSNELQIVYYPLEQDSYNMNMYEWYNRNSEPTSDQMRSNPDVVKKASTKKVEFVKPTSFYIFEIVLNCIANCKVAVVSDGEIIAYKNDRTFLFEMNFVTKWQYALTTPIQGLVHIEFHVRNANYFDPIVSGSSYQTYRPLNPIGNYLLKSLPQDINKCNIPNCINCQGNICLSCNRGFFLSIDGTSCQTDCAPNKSYEAERKCMRTCGNAFDNNDGTCIPSCNYNAKIYSKELGCVTCVPGCSRCESLTTCRTCLYQNPANTPTYCPRSGGSLYKSLDFTTNQTINFYVNEGSVYIAIIADESQFMGGVLYFMNPERRVPRIFNVIRLNPISNTLQEGIVPPIPVSQKGKISIHYVILKPEEPNVFTNYTITGFYSKNYLDFPLSEKFPMIYTGNGLFEYESSGGFFDGPETYQTVVAQKIFTHDIPATITCQAQIRFKGYLRGFHVNGQLIIFDSTLNLQSNTKTITTRPITIGPNEYFYVTLTGYMMQVNSFVFQGCLNSKNEPVSPNFSSFILYNNPGASDTLQIANNTYCSQNCLKCIDNTRCLECERNFFLQEGKCVSQCSGAYPYSTVLGLCDTTLRSQGSQIARPYYHGNLEAIIAQYNLILGYNADIIAVAFPYQSKFGTFPGIIPSGTKASLAQSTYSVTHYRSTDSILNLNLPIQVFASSEGLLTANFALFTIKHNYILLVKYSQLYPDITDFSKHLEFEYASTKRDAFTLDKENTFYFNFFINCTGSCQLKFHTDGFIMIKANYRTFLYSAVFDSSFQTYELQRRLTGLTFLEIYIWDSTTFDYTINGAHNIFSYDQFILTDNVLVPETENCPAECLNCFKGQCLSCTNGQVLTAATGTCGGCTNSQNTLLEERLCISTTCEAIGLITSTVDDSTCTRVCPNNYFYYDLTNGCTNPCSGGCLTCDGPSESDCLSCIAPRILNLQTNTCDCPIGTNPINEVECQSRSFLQLSGDDISQSCTDLKLEALIRKDESQAYEISFRWDLIQTTAGAEGLRRIKEYLAAQSSRIIFIPSNLLQRNNFYNFTVAYTNVLGEVYKSYLATKTIADYIPHIIIDGGLPQTLASRYNNQIIALVTYSQCLDLTTPLKTSWSFISGTPVSVSNLYNYKTPLKLMIPKCTLKPNTTAIIQFRAWVDNYLWLSQTKTITISVLPEEFQIAINNGSREHPQDLDLVLSGTVIDDQSCTSENPISYAWTCYRAVMNYDSETKDSDVLTENMEVARTVAIINELGDAANSKDFADYSDVVRFVACYDPDMIFNKPNSNSEIIIPSYYFKQGDVLHLNLTATKGGFSDSATTQIIIESPSELALEISCKGTCMKYSNNFKYDFIGNIVTSVREDEMFNYAWTVDPPLPCWSYENQFKIVPHTLQLGTSIDFLKIVFNVQNEEHFGTAFMLLPINKPPINGKIIVFPSSGQALTTYFNVLTENWDDDDLPLTYQFSYAFASEPGERTLLSDSQLTPQTSTILPGRDSAVEIVIVVTAQDSYGARSVANTTVTVQSQTTSLQEAISQVQNMLSSLEDYDPLEKVKIITVLNSNINQIEEKISEDILENSCPHCSGNGYCLANISRCVCEPGWTLSDCSLPEEQYQAIIDFKKQSLEAIQNNTQLINDETGQEMIYNALKVSSASEVFNNNETLAVVQDILENTLNITDESTILDEDESNVVSDILSNMMSYSALYDCAGVTNFTADLRNKTAQYLDKISKSSLKDLFPGENGTIISTDNFDILTQKLKLCQLSNKIFSTGGDSPNVSFNLTPEQQKDCSTDINLQYYAFSQGLLDCSANPQEEKKSHLAIKISESESGEDISVEIPVIVDYTDDTECPAMCEELEDGSCYCPNLSPFDVKGQIIRIFTISKLSDLFNISALLSFAFWQTSAFWTLIVLTLWFILTFYFVKYKWPTYHVIDVFKNKEQKTTWEALKTAVKATHPLLNVYYLYDEDLLKTIRATLYYSRTILLLLFTSIFTEDDESLDNVAFQVLNFNVYLLLLPFFTIIPIGAFSEYLIKKPKEDQNNPMSPGKAKFHLWKNRFGYFFTTSALIGSLLAIIIILANQSAEERMEWTANFIQSLIQDLLLTPALYLALQYFLLRVLENQYLDKKPRIKSLVMKQVDPSLWLLKENLLGYSVAKVIPLALESVRPQNQAPSQLAERVPYLKDLGNRETETQGSCETETGGIMEALQRLAEVRTIAGQIRGIIKEESYEDSPGLNLNKNRERISNIRKEKPKLTDQEEVFSKAFFVPASQFSIYAKSRPPQLPSLQDDDLEGDILDTSIERNRRGEKLNNSPKSRPQDFESNTRNNYNDNKSTKPNSWHNDMDSGLLTSVTRVNNPLSLKGLDSPSIGAQKNSPTTSGSESRRELLSPSSRQMQTLRGSDVSDQGSQDTKKTSIEPKVLSLRRKTNSRLKTFLQKEEVKEDASKVSDNLSRVDSDFDLTSERRSRIPLNGRRRPRFETETGIEVCNIDELPKKIDMQVDGDDLKKGYEIESNIFNAKVGRNVVRRKMKGYMNS